MAKLSEEMTRILEEAGAGLKALKEEIINIQFDPNDPVSVTAAIDHVERMIDEKIAPFRDNRLVEDAADQIKEECRPSILRQVAERKTDPGVRTLH